MSKVITIISVLVIAILSGCAAHSALDKPERPDIDVALELPEGVKKPQVRKAERGEDFIMGAVGMCAKYINEPDAAIAVKTADELAAQQLMNMVRSTMADQFLYDRARMGNTNPKIMQSIRNTLSKEAVIELRGVETYKRDCVKGVVYSYARWSKTNENIFDAIDQARQKAAQEIGEEDMRSAEPIWEGLKEKIKALQ